MLVAALAVALVPRDLVERLRGNGVASGAASAAAAFASGASAVSASPAKGVGGQPLAGAVTSAASATPALVDASVVVPVASAAGSRHALDLAAGNRGPARRSSAPAGAGGELLRVGATGDQLGRGHRRSGARWCSRIVKAGEQVGVDGALPLACASATSRSRG